MGREGGTGKGGWDGEGRKGGTWKGGGWDVEGREGGTGKGGTEERRRERV